MRRGNFSAAQSRDGGRAIRSSPSEPFHPRTAPGNLPNRDTNVTPGEMKRNERKRGTGSKRDQREERVETPPRFESASHDIYIYFWPRSALVARHQHNEDSPSLLVLLGNACPCLSHARAQLSTRANVHVLPVFLSVYTSCFTAGLHNFRDQLDKQKQ